MPIAKSAETQVQQVAPSVNPPDTTSRLDIGGVPLSVFSLFDAPLNIKE